MSEYTKGEWKLTRINSDEVWVTCNQNKIASVIYPLSERQEQMANARLIAAAPDLLEACEGTEPWCLRQYAERANELASKPNLAAYRVILNNIGGMFEILTTEAEKRQAVIAKAKKK